MAHEDDSHNDGRTQSAAKWAFMGFLIIAAYLLITEHRAHLLGWLSSYWIFLLVIACPLMHLFMHRGHGHGGHGSSEVANRSTREKQ